MSLGKLRFICWDKGLSIGKIAFLRGETKQVSCAFLVTKPRKFFQASRIGRQTILGKFDWPACWLQLAVSHPCICESRGFHVFPLLRTAFYKLNHNSPGICVVKHKGVNSWLLGSELPSHRLLVRLAFARGHNFFCIAELHGIIRPVCNAEDNVLRRGDTKGLQRLEAYFG